MPQQPMAEVFGFPIDNFSDDAVRVRQHKLCPFGNRIPQCMKDKTADPLGVCSVFDNNGTSIICPVRFREGWKIIADAARFFFPANASYVSLGEVRLTDAQGKSAGNIDYILVSYNDKGELIDFGSLEVQGVYISGTIRTPFSEYMKDPSVHRHLNWQGKTNYPRPDYVSSSRKRLGPQLLFKGGILHSWGKKGSLSRMKKKMKLLLTTHQ